MKDFKFSIPIAVRIGDINYGNHVGHHNYFLYFQESRIAYLKRFGFSELDINGYGMVISHAECKYKQELYLGDNIKVKCRVTQLKSKVFIMDYQIEKMNTVCAVGSTTNLCFDYRVKKVVNLPQEFVKAIKEFEGIFARPLSHIKKNTEN